MANLTLKGVPAKVHAELKRRAVAARRSLNSEAILCLERALSEAPPARVDPEAFTRQVREAQAKYQIKPLSAKQLRAAIREGRE
jgi:plasmid stability protein